METPAPSGAARLRLERSLTLLRIGIGVIWALNLVYVVDPANGFFPTFSTTALGFAGSSLGGAVLPTFVAAHASIFAALVAGCTAYLAVAFLVGGTTRIACVVGGLFNAALLVTQVGGLVNLPGGTDIGPQPLYLLVYLTLFAGAGLDSLSVDRWWTAVRAARRPAVSDLPSSTRAA